MTAILHRGHDPAYSVQQRPPSFPRREGAVCGIIAGPRPVLPSLMNSGVIYAALAFLSWGLFPLYFRAISDVPASQILLHRIIWSLVFLAVVLAVRRQWNWVPPLLRRPKVI